MKWRYVAALAALAAALSTPAVAITVISQSANTDIILGVSYTKAEFENPLGGFERVKGRRVIEWRDADYEAGWYDDWYVSGSGIDGCESEIWMRQSGQYIWTTTRVASTAVSIHLNGDNNDGIAEVLVDGTVVAKLDMYTLGRDRALVVVEQLALSTHDIRVNDLGQSQDPNGGDDVAVLGAAALGGQDIKWGQPPNPSDTKVFNGWNETSVYSGSQIAADDWICQTMDPVTNITWWGSFQNWQSPDVPPQTPDAFTISIWTNSPAVGGGFAHPKQVLWQHSYSSATCQFAGWDYDPQTEQIEACFRYDLTVPQADWFSQTAFNQIYWISIAAEYYNGPPTDQIWGWKTRPWDPDSAAPGDAVRITDPTSPVMGSQYVSGQRIEYPSGTGWQMAFGLSSRAMSVVKFRQPPVYKSEYDAYFGWDESSAYGSSQIVADDWVCHDWRPVTGVTWWGSYQGWNEQNPPDDAPTSFHVAIWTDVPVGEDEPFSHPGVLLWEKWASRSELGETYVRDDYHPEHGTDSCFGYSLTIPENEWFYQSYFKSVYWLSISADYAGTTALFPWGWKSRPRGEWPLAPDGAVRVFNPTAPSLNDNYISGEAILDGTGNPWDMAFTLHTIATYEWFTKWWQPPVAHSETYDGWNEKSVYSSEQIVGDDWRCFYDLPVTDFHWWGSFLGSSKTVPPQMPDAFHIAIWNDVPTGSGGDPFSHPSDVVWEMTSRDFTWEFVGWDIDPRNPNAVPEACFKFNAYVPHEQWFSQGPLNHTYWLSIAAVYDAGQPGQYAWGWKTRLQDMNSQAPDAAVTIWDPTSPVQGSLYSSGWPIEYPQGTKWDAAFEITTPLPGSLLFSDYYYIWDHFWWPEHPDPHNEMISLSVWADPTEDVAWDSVTLQAHGTGDDKKDITSVQVWLDANANGQVDAGDTPIGTGTYPSNDGTTTITLLPAPVIPANNSISALITYVMKPSASIGSTYWFDVTGATATGQRSYQQLHINGLPLASAKKIVGVSPVTIGQAKRLQPDEVWILLEGKIVTANFPPGDPEDPGIGMFYIQEPDMSAGIGAVPVEGAPIPALGVGAEVSVLGWTEVAYSTELVLWVCQVLPRLGYDLEPVGMSNRSSGGGQFGYQPAVMDIASPPPPQPASGLSSVGLLVRTAGMFTGYNPLTPLPWNTDRVAWFDDGSALVDGFNYLGGQPATGIAVLLPPDMPGLPSGYCGVTGIMKAIPNPTGLPVRLLVPRNAADMDFYLGPW